MHEFVVVGIGEEALRKVRKDKKRGKRKRSVSDYEY